MKALIEGIAQRLVNNDWLLTTAESCTGGGVAQCLTSVSGSSFWFDRGFITYSNEAKQEMLGVSEELLEKHGAVSEQAVVAMARGALAHSRAQASLAVTGIAGPSGGTSEKPVGTVWFAWALETETKTACQVFAGDRQAIRQQSEKFSLQGLLDFLP
ncbi:MAG: CinA family protein [Gammaproteobacteria bacterium]|nr:CinA family protein [Gammaproteobacteria bacterium]